MNNSPILQKNRYLSNVLPKKALQFLGQHHVTQNLVLGKAPGFNSKKSASRCFFNQRIISSSELG